MYKDRTCNHAWLQLHWTVLLGYSSLVQWCQDMVHPAHVNSIGMVMVAVAAIVAIAAIMLAAVVTDVWAVFISISGIVCIFAILAVVYTCMDWNVHGTVREAREMMAELQHEDINNAIGSSD